MTFTVPPGATVTELLDIGSRSLLYFEAFAPRYQRYHGSLSPEQEYASLHTCFYQQNGLSEAKLRGTADMLTEVLTTLRAQRDVQHTAAQGVAGAWQGQAAESAVAVLGEQLSLADADIAATESIRNAVEQAPAGLRTVITGKAQIVLQILEHGVDVKIDGKTPEDVDVIISGAEGLGFSNGWSENSEMRRLERIFPDIPEGLFDRNAQIETRWLSLDILMPGSDYEKVIRDRCKHWLDVIFVPDYERKVSDFRQMCESVDAGVRRIYQTITDAVGGIPEEKYPVPAGEGVPAGTTPTGTVPASTTPASTTPASTTPTSTTPTSTTPTTTVPSTTTVPTTTVPTTTVPTTTTPSTTANPLSQLSTLAQTAQTLTPIAESVAQSIGTGLSALTEAVTTGVEDALERVEDVLGPGRDADGDGRPDPLAEFPLGDERVSVTVEDGRLTLTLTAADGTGTEYRLQTDDQGRPVLVEIGPDGQPVEPGAEDEPGAPDADDGEGGDREGDGETGADADGAAGDSDGDREQPGESDPDDSGTGDERSGPGADGERPGGDQPEQPGSPGAPTGVTPPGQRREEDGEHHPQHYPPTEPVPGDPEAAPPTTPLPTQAPPTPAEHEPQGTPAPADGAPDAPLPTSPPLDSGAELSEAGPL